MSVCSICGCGCTGRIFSMGTMFAPGPGSNALSIALSAVSGDPVCCALSKARPSTTSRLCARALGLGRGYAFGTVAMHPTKGDHIIARRVTFGGTDVGPIAVLRPMGGRCRFGNTPALISKLGNGNGCGANH